MNEREKKIQLWFEMWLQQKDLGIDEIFTEDAVCTESWGPEYKGRTAIKHWFEEWNTRGRVVVWDIKQFFHKDNQTIAEWHFRDKMDDGRSDEFDGMSLVEWTNDNRIRLLKEFGCNTDNYDPYKNGDAPQFRQEKALWF